MKTFKFLCSQNGFEYSGKLTVKANNCKWYWQGEEHSIAYDKKNYQDSDGNTIEADGVIIQIDEHFEYHGTE